MKTLKILAVILIFGLGFADLSSESNSSEGSGTITKELKDELKGAFAAFQKGAIDCFTRILVKLAELKINDPSVEEEIFDAIEKIEKLKSTNLGDLSMEAGQELKDSLEGTIALFNSFNFNAESQARRKRETPNCETFRTERTTGTETLVTFYVINSRIDADIAKYQLEIEKYEALISQETNIVTLNVYKNILQKNKDIKAALLTTKNINEEAMRRVQLKQEYLDQRMAATCESDSPLCGNLLKYDPVYSYNEPITNGFESGRDIDGARIFPGITTKSCSGDAMPIKVRILDNGTYAISDGGYSLCLQAPVERYDELNSFYFEKSQYHQWVKTDIFNIDNVANKVLVSGKIPYYVGRINLKDANGKIYQQIGTIARGVFYYVAEKVALPPTTYNVKRLKVDGVSTGYEVLVCNTPPPPPTPEPCGNLIKYDPSNPDELITRGFYSGFYIDDNPLYPGIGNFGCAGQDPSPARIQGPGGYCSCSELPLERLDTSSAYFFEKSPRLQWIPANSSTFSSIAGKVAVQTTLTFYVGRVNFTINERLVTQIGKIADGKMWYTNPVDPNEYPVPVTFSNYDVLVCV